MKKHLLTASLAFVAATGIGAAADSDPILMTVDGHDIRVSEFEYLYNKNNTQQLQPQTLDQYLQMFVDYKLKVAEAEHAGLDTMASFRTEYDGFRRELAQPYLRDTTVIEQLVLDDYNRRRTAVKVSHIMLPPTPDGLAAADSIHAAIVEGTVSFEDAARANSIDRGSSMQGGLMGVVVPDRYPYAFETAAYTTPVGQISEPVNSGMGYHIIRVESSEPNPGEVLVKHILLLSRGDSTEAIVRERIDSLYNVAITPGADFAALARQYSQDPGSARNGGDLPWFGPGAMVAEFDSAAFATPTGTISQPFRTRFGYHIINKLDSRTLAPLAELRPQIMDAISNDDRSIMPARAVIDRLVAERHAKVLPKALGKIRKMLTKNATGYDSIMKAKMAVSDLVVATYDGGGRITLAEVMERVPVTSSTDIENAVNHIGGAANILLREKLRTDFIDNLANTNPDYRNLLNEYRDGILLYEISSRKVWDRAARDTTGLEEYFRNNRDKYRWEQPKFKSFIIFASSDSVLNAALEYAPTLSTADPQAFTAAMRERFGRDVKVERVIAAQGENPITDYLAFGGDKPAADARTRWAAYAAYQGRIINEPETSADVRGAAVTDYQSQLDAEWLQELRNKYPVHINQSVFEAIKAAQR